MEFKLQGYGRGRRPCRLRHCPTRRKVAGSIPDVVSNTSSRIMFLGTTQAWFMWSDFILKWSEVSYGEILVDKSTLHIRVTLYWGYLIVLWQFFWCVSCIVIVLTCTVVVVTCFVMCGCLVVCVLVFTVFCIVCTMFLYFLFMYIYSYLFCLYWCKDCCHRLTTQLQLIIIIIIIIIITIVCNCTNFTKI